MRINIFNKWHVKFAARKNAIPAKKFTRISGENYVMYRWRRMSFTVTDLRAEVFWVCAECDSMEEMKSISCGDEGWHVCPACETIEGRTRYVSALEVGL